MHRSFCWFYRVAAHFLCNKGIYLFYMYLENDCRIIDIFSKTEENHAFCDFLLRKYFINKTRHHQEAIKCDLQVVYFETQVPLAFWC